MGLDQTAPSVFTVTFPPAISDMKVIGYSAVFKCHVCKGEHFCEFFLAFLDEKALYMGSTHKEKNLLIGEQILTIMS